LLACSVLLLTACGPVGDGDDSGTSGSGGAVRDGGTMTVALADDPDMLDPTLARTLVGRMVFMLHSLLRPRRLLLLCVGRCRLATGSSPPNRRLRPPRSRLPPPGWMC
jgi:hypothetical protein